MQRRIVIYLYDEGHIAVGLRMTQWPKRMATESELFCSYITTLVTWTEQDSVCENDVRGQIACAMNAFSWIIVSQQVVLVHLSLSYIQSYRYTKRKLLLFPVTFPFIFRDRLHLGRCFSTGGPRTFAIKLYSELPMH
jgi:hypothetical protein